MNKHFYLGLGLIITIFLHACTKNNIEDEFGDCQPENVSFVNSVKSIIDLKCVVCHNTTNPAGGLDLSQFSAVKNIADNGKLLGTINHDDGFKVMPPDGTKIDACDILTIKTWIHEGSKNN